MHPIISIRRRCEFWWQAIRHTWSLLVVIVVGVWGFLSLVRDELFPEEVQGEYQIGDILPSLSIETWALIGSLMLLAIVLEAGYRTGKKLQKNLDVLNTPAVSLDLYGEIQEDIEGVQRAFLEVTGISSNKVRVEVFGTAARATSTESGYDSYGRFILYLGSGAATPFSVHRGETHRSIPVIRYDPREVGPSIHVEVPLQIPTSDIIRGNKFSLVVSAFGGTLPATLELRFGVDYDTRRLWIKKEGSTEVLRSTRLEASPRQLDEKFHEGFEGS